MKKIISVLGIIASLMLPSISSAASQKTFTGVVIGINGSQIMFSTTSAAKYAAEVGSAQLTRKNGVPMKFSEIKLGDKIEAKGQLWGDNSISAVNLKNMSLYAHKGTFSGKIISINSGDLSFTMQSKTYGTQTIHTNNFTSFTKNGGNAGFKDLILDMTASVKGVWDRSNTDVVATSIAGTYRLINIYFTGVLSINSALGFTVIGNGNVIYGVDISKAELQNKSGKQASANNFIYGDNLRVWGEHLSGSSQIVGTKIKDTSR